MFSSDLPTRSAARGARRLLPLLALALLPLLAACEITFSGRVDVEPSPGFAVTSASFSTDYRADVDGDGRGERFVICDDRTTNLTYTFSYDGDLESWRSYLRGVDSGEIRGDVQLTPGSPVAQIIDRDTIRVNYAIQARAAPLLQGEPEAQPQIVVVPVPRVIGYTRLFLEVSGYAPYAIANNRASTGIPVLESCPS